LRTISYSNLIEYGAGYKWNNTLITINVGDYVQWSWASVVGVSGINYKIQQIATPSGVVGSGFDSGDATPAGSFVQQFNTPGTFYYWSTFVDPSGKISLRGAVIVEPSSDQELQISVTQGEFQGIYQHINY
jgi:plastocyanin